MKKCKRRLFGGGYLINIFVKLKLSILRLTTSIFLLHVFAQSSKIQCIVFVTVQCFTSGAVEWRYPFPQNALAITSRKREFQQLSFIGVFRCNMAISAYALICVIVERRYMR